MAPRPCEPRAPADPCAVAAMRAGSCAPCTPPSGARASGARGWHAHRSPSCHARARDRHCEDLLPIYVDASYYVEPDKGGERAFRLFRDALEHAGLAGIATKADGHRKANGHRRTARSTAAARHRPHAAPARRARAHH